MDPNVDAPSNQGAFLHDCRVGAWRIGFYWLVTLLSVIAGRSSAAGSWSLVPITDCLALSAIFLPFLYLYSLLFELSTIEHFPYYFEKRTYFRGPYRWIGWIGLAFLVPFVLGVVFCVIKNLVPVYICLVQVLLPCGLAQSLLANKYRLLQLLRKDQNPKPFYKMKPYKVQLIAITALAALVGGFGSFSAYQGNAARLWIVLAVAWIVYAACAWVGYPKKRTDLGPMFFFEKPLRELIALFSVLALPFIIGVASYNASYGNEITVSHLLTPQNIATMAVLVVTGLVFELIRYLGRYQVSYFARSSAVIDNELAPAVLPKSFQQSVRNYTLVLVSVLSLLPLFYFFAELNVKLNLMVTPFAAAMIGAVFFVLRPFGSMGFAPRRHIEWGSFRHRSIKLAGIYVFGYAFLLVILIVGFCIMSVTGQPSSSSTPHALELVSIFLSGFITIIVGVVLSSILVGEGNAVSGLSITVGVIAQALIIGCVDWTFFTYYTAFQQDPIASSTSLPAYWSGKVERLVNHGDAVYLGLTYIILAMLLLMIAAFDRVRVSKEKLALLNLLVERCPAVPRTNTPGLKEQDALE